MADQNSEILIKLQALDNLTPVMVQALKNMEANSSKMASALDKVGESTSKTAEHTEGLHGGLVSLEAGFTLAEKAVEFVDKGFEFLKESMEKSIEVALEAETAQNRLAGALISSGKYTSSLNEELNEYAEHLQRTTGVSAETVKSILATGLNMGLTTEKAQALVSASQKLAAATGTDVQSAFQKLQGSLAGHARALSMNVAGVNDLSASQLKNGAAIDLVNQQLSAQYAIYQGSFSAGVARAHEGVEDLYKTFGNLIVQNPAMKEALSQFGTAIGQLGDFVASNKSEMQQWVSGGVLVVIDSMEGVNVAFDAVYRGGVIAFNGLEGAVQSFALGVVTLVDGPFALFYEALSYLPGEQGKQFQVAADAIGDHMTAMAGEVNKSAEAIDQAMAGPTKTSQALTDKILGIREAVQGAIATEGAHKAALEITSEAMARQNGAAAKLQQTYAGFAYGNSAMREALAHEVSDRDTDLKKFEEYLNAKERLAIGKAQEQQMAVHAIASKAIVGAAGGSDTSAAAQVEVDNEAKKQASISILHKKGILDEKQYRDALLGSVQRTQMSQLSMDQAFAKAEADVLGNSPAGFQKRQLLAQQQFQLQLQQKRVRGQQEGLTEKQISAMEESENKAHLAQMMADEQRYYQSQAEVNMELGDNFQAYLDRVHAAQVQQGTVMGAITATTNSQQFKAMQQSFAALSGLMNSHSKGAFEVGKAAAIANAVISTAAGAAAALAPPPLGIGPLFGGILAGATILAGGVQIAEIASQQFNPGGQADEGMDSIPSSLNGKSFVLSQGERVVQPEANKDLTAFLAKQGGSGAGGGGAPIYNLTVNYSGSMSKDDVDNLSKLLIKKIRSESDKGAPILNAKGVVSA
jgi:hypothetical protein